MIKQLPKNEITDDTKLVRFVDKNGAVKSIGDSESRGNIHFSFHYGLLSYYLTLENNAGDSREGSTDINLGDGRTVNHTTADNALISSWSIWDGNCDPWIFFQDSSFTHDPYICALVSTVGKVRKIVQATIELNKLFLGENYDRFIVSQQDRVVNYYPRDTGVPQEYWDDITSIKHGSTAATLSNIYHKRDRNEKNQWHNVEKEYRYSILLGNCNLPIINQNIMINTQELIIRDYRMIIFNNPHFIEQVYLKTTNAEDELDITTACYQTNVPFVKSLISKSNLIVDA
jgi:hypothetical protein